jgi:succinoglycan biosynthesis transport protein ExoP
MAYESPTAEDTRIDVAALWGAIVRKLPRILLVTVALLAIAFVVLMFQPRLYESTASILVEPRANSFVRPSGEQAPTIGQGNGAGVVSSQIELLKSRDTLLTVIDRLDLRSVPEFNGSQGGFSPLGMISQLLGRRASTPNSIDETVLNTLYQRLAVSQERDSAIISVTVSSTDPELAAEIANAVANAHVARRASLSLSDTADASSWLLEEINRLRGTVQEAEAAVAEFRVENGLIQVGQGNTSLLDQQLSTVGSQITAAQERQNAALSRASLIRDLIARNQPIEGVTDVQGSAVIQQLSQEKARLQGELAQRSATLLSNHPAIRALNAQISELNNQIRLEAQRVAASLEAEAEVQAGLEASLRSDLESAMANASTATIDNVTLDSLEREAKAQRDLLEAYLLRYNEASSRVEAESALPDVRVVSVAAPTVTPSSPKTGLIMTGVGIVAFAVQIGAVAFGELMSGRALVPVGRRQLAQDELESVPFDESELEPEQRWQDEPVSEVAQENSDDALDFYEPPVEAEVAPEPVIAVTPVIVQPVFDLETEAETEADEADLPDRDAALAEIHAVLATPSASEAVDPTEPEDEPVAVLPPASHAKTARVLRYPDLVSDLVLGRTHLLLLADHGDAQPSRILAEDLCGDALGKGLSVALIDAGTGIRTTSPGLTDLSTGEASFGDVVQKSADNSFAEVTWGQGRAIDRSSSRPITLAEALGDIYEVVVILTGKVGRASSLPDFAELGGRIVLVMNDEDDAETADATRLWLEENGLSRVEIAALPEPVAA